MHWLRPMINLIAVAVGVYSALVGALYLMQRQIIYQPAQFLPSPAASGLPKMQTIRLYTEDGIRLTSWYRAAQGGQPTMIYFHGNGGNIAGRAFKARPYLDAGFGLLMLEYRGYGGNSGEPSEQGLYADGRAGLEFLNREGMAPGRWVLYGESLGTGVAVQLAMEQAARTPVGAVVLESPFTTMGDAAAIHYPFVPVRTLLKDRYDSISKIGKIRAPVFIFQGENDSVISPKLGKRLFQAAREPKEGRWIPGAGHNNLHEFGVFEMVIDFVRRKIDR